MLPNSYLDWERRAELRHVTHLPLKRCLALDINRDFIDFSKEKKTAFAVFKLSLCGILHSSLDLCQITVKNINIGVVFHIKVALFLFL